MVSTKRLEWLPRQHFKYTFTTIDSPEGLSSSTLFVLQFKVKIKSYFSIHLLWFKLLNCYILINFHRH